MHQRCMSSRTIAESKYEKGGAPAVRGPVVLRYFRFLPEPPRTAGELALQGT